MLEGKEYEKELGGYGAVSVDLKPDGNLEISLIGKVDLIAELRKLAQKSDNKLDDKMVDMIESALRK